MVWQGWTATQRQAAWPARSHEMIELLTDERGFPHFLAALVLLSRIGDVLSTYLVSPTLLLESNAFVRRWGWPLALPSLLFFFLPYYSPAIGVVVLPTSFLVL